MALAETTMFTMFFFMVFSFSFLGSYVYLLAIGCIAKYVPSDGLRGIIGKALLINRFLTKKVPRKIRRKAMMRRNIVA